MKVFFHVECQVSTGKENIKKKATVLKIVLGKQPLHDSTSTILNQAPVEPEPFQSTLEAATDKDAVPDPLAAITVEKSPLRSLCRDTNKSPPSTPGYLDDLFEKLTDSETLGEKLNRVLDNQKALFLLMSKLIGDVAQNLRNLAQLSSNVAQIARIQGSGVGDRVGLVNGRALQGVGDRVRSVNERALHWVGDRVGLVNRTTPQWVGDRVG